LQFLPDWNQLYEVSTIAVKNFPEVLMFKYLHALSLLKTSRIDNVEALYNEIDFDKLSFEQAYYLC
jgi:hypothetical protein